MTAAELRTRERELSRELRALRKKIRAASGNKRTPSRQQTRREEHEASTEALRALVWARCGGTATGNQVDGWTLEGVGRDEITGEELGAAWHLHHVQGAGERRSKQRPGSVLALSWETYRRIHRGDLDMLRRVASAPALDAEARRAAQRRADKAIAARGVPLRVRVA